MNEENQFVLINFYNAILSVVRVEKILMQNQTVEKMMAEKNKR